MKYVITDPCYILDNEAWDRCCEIARSKDDWYDIFNNAVKDELEKLSGKEAYACETGFGDWDNSIYGSSYSKIEKLEFCADSGMVCVCALTNNVEESLKQKFPAGYNGCVAVIDCEGEVEVKMDKRDKGWTVVNIKDNNDIFYSQDPFNEDEE